MSIKAREFKIGRPWELKRGGYSILRLRRLFIRDWHGGMGWIGTVCLRWLCIPRLGLFVVRAFFWRTRCCTTVPALSLVQSSSQNRSSCLFFHPSPSPCSSHVAFCGKSFTVLSLCFAKWLGDHLEGQDGATAYQKFPTSRQLPFSLCAGFGCFVFLRGLHGLEFKLKSLRSDEWLDFDWWG